MPKLVVAITENMVKAGLKVLEQAVDDTPDDGSEIEGDGAAAMTDAQVVIHIFTEMWRVKCAEELAIKAGKAPRIIKPKTNGLIMPTKQ